jgi:hypothetical protein
MFFLEEAYLILNALLSFMFLNGFFSVKFGDGISELSSIIFFYLFFLKMLFYDDFFIFLISFYFKFNLNKKEVYVL